MLAMLLCLCDRPCFLATDETWTRALKFWPPRCTVFGGCHCCIDCKKPERVVHTSCSLRALGWLRKRTRFAARNQTRTRDDYGIRASRPRLPLALLVVASPCDTHPTLCHPPSFLPSLPFPSLFLSSLLTTTHLDTKKRTSLRPTFCQCTLHQRDLGGHTRGAVCLPCSFSPCPNLCLLCSLLTFTHLPRSPFPSGLSAHPTPDQHVHTHTHTHAHT